MVDPHWLAALVLLVDEHRLLLALALDFPPRVRLRHRLSRQNKYLRKVTLNNKIYIPNKNASAKLRITTDVLAVQLLLLVHAVGAHALTPNIAQLPLTVTLVY